MLVKVIPVFRISWNPRIHSEILVRICISAFSELGYKKMYELTGNKQYIEASVPWFHFGTLRTAFRNSRA